MKKEKTLKTGDPIQNRDKKKPHGDSKRGSVLWGTEVTADSETRTLETKQMKNKTIVSFRESRELDTWYGSTTKSLCSYKMYETEY